ncbi:hypothetical protein J6TS2_06920 [Heyndrickxia sporothermodurans]|nr:hypothetical protein J6TS2_06920 [Heyndrickxia sporothermodurans]
MPVKVTMANGKEYLVDTHIDEFMKKVTNQMGLMTNVIQKFGDLIINPTFISSVEVIDRDRK